MLQNEGSISKGEHSYLTGSCARSVILKQSWSQSNLSSVFFFIYMHSSYLERQQNKTYPEWYHISTSFTLYKTPSTIWRTTLYYTVRQNLSTTWLVSIISFLIMNLFQIGLLFSLPVHTYLLTGTCKMRNEIETKRNKSKRNSPKRNEIYRNETKRNWPKRNETE